MSDLKISELNVTTDAQNGDLFALARGTSNFSISFSDFIKNLARKDVGNTFAGSNTFSSPLTVGTPTATGHAATKAYTDTALSSKKDLSVDVAFSAKPSSNFTLSGVGFRKLLFGTENFDRGSCFASSTFTVPTGKSGLYFIAGSVFKNSGTTSPVPLFAYVNGSLFATAGEIPSTSASAGISGSFVLNLAAGDTVELYTYCETGTHTYESTKMNFYGFIIGT